MICTDVQVYLQNQGVRRSKGKWVQLLNATFGLPFGGQGRNIKDYSCQLSSAQWLSTYFGWSV
ncbi:hypothetical protein [Arachidicoccus sp.]|jgi:hypothetical protein|uniref:hypothetical protein n=1 Tax=Arachidicoccus sp. TaxID=1872624 RepID=UPI003D1CDE0E